MADNSQLFSLLISFLFFGMLLGASVWVVWLVLGAFGKWIGDCA